MLKINRLFRKSLDKLSPNTRLFLILIAMMLIGFYLGTKQEDIRFLLTKPDVFGVFQSAGESISAKQLAGLLKNKNFTLINVHTPYEGEIEKTDTFIAYDQIISQSSSLPKDKNAPIVLYCKTGRMSEEALETLKKLGYTNVRHLAGGMDAWAKNKGKMLDLSNLEKEVLPKEGIELPISWGNLGPKLIEAGVIDLAKFKKTVNMTPEQEKMLTQGSDEKIRIDSTNSQFIVDMLWALGLGQKSIVYEDGPMGKEYKNDAGNFASTGGWPLAKGDAMDHLNKHDFIALSPEQQIQVSEIAQNIYRPCCGNSTWFPDCNHGMAALAIIELLVANNVDEKTIYRKVLGFNSFWFGDSYLYIATHFARQGVSWVNVDAKAVLGKDYSSSQGAAAIAKKVGNLPFRQNSGGGCGA